MFTQSRSPITDHDIHGFYYWPSFSIHLLIHIPDTVRGKTLLFLYFSYLHFDWKTYSPWFVYETSRSVADSVITTTTIVNDKVLSTFEELTLKRTSYLYRFTLKRNAYPSGQCTLKGAAGIVQEYSISLPILLVVCPNRIQACSFDAIQPFVPAENNISNSIWELLIIYSREHSVCHGLVVDS